MRIHAHAASHTVLAVLVTLVSGVLGLNAHMQELRSICEANAIDQEQFVEKSLPDRLEIAFLDITSLYGRSVRVRARVRVRVRVRVHVHV